MKKRFGILIMSMIMACTLAIPAGAVQQIDLVESDASTEHLIYDDGSISNATVADVDELMQKRTQAIFEGNEEKADMIMEEMMALGVRPSTQEEIDLFAAPQKFTSNESNGVASNGTMQLKRATQFVTTPYTSTVNGVTYNVKRIENVSSTSSNLYHKGVVAKKTTGNKAASAFGVCKALGTAAAGIANSTAGNALSVYSALSGTAAAVSSTAIIKDIVASYTYQVQEYCQFYSYKNASGSWVPFAVGSYADMTVTAVMLKLTPSGGVTSTLNNITKTYNNKLYTSYSHPTNKAANTTNLLKEYLNSYTFINRYRVLSTAIYSDGTNVVRNIGLVAPTTTSEIN